MPKTRWFLDIHAVQRMKEMDVERAEVIACLDDPETDYPSPKSYGVGYRVATRGRLAVVYNQDEEAVVTVLWAGRDSR